MEQVENLNFGALAREVEIKNHVGAIKQRIRQEGVTCAVFKVGKHNINFRVCPVNSFECRDKIRNSVGVFVGVFKPETPEEYIREDVEHVLK